MTASELAYYHVVWQLLKLEAHPDVTYCEAVRVARGPGVLEQLIRSRRVIHLHHAEWGTKPDMG